MKKLFVFALAVILVAVFAMPASAAVVNKFGGYLENVWSSYKHRNYVDTGSDDLQQIRYRHRLFYSATVHENLKFNFASEIDTVWGDTIGGDVGADGNPIFDVGCQRQGSRECTALHTGTVGASAELTP